jgi:GT2 family glycosyltransferase
MTLVEGPGLASRRVCALLTCFNRRDKTLTALSALRASFLHAGVEPYAVLVDDASHDGTAVAVRERFPWVLVLESPGDLYWCRGMHLAFAEALKRGADFYLWLNDDTFLEEDALRRLMHCHDEVHAREGRPLIVVGSTRDADSGALTYGGENRVSRWRPARFAKVAPPLAAQRVDTFDGNIVLVSAAAAARVGNLDAAFEHAMGDTDYGLRAARAGVPTWLAPGWHGRCPENPLTNTQFDASLPWSRRWRLMLGRKGLPPRSWWRFNRRHAGWLWPLSFAWPYARMWLLRLGLAAERRA